MFKSYLSHATRKYLDDSKLCGNLRPPGLDTGLCEDRKHKFLNYVHAKVWLLWTMLIHAKQKLWYENKSWHTNRLKSKVQVLRMIL